MFFGGLQNELLNFPENLLDLFAHFLLPTTYIVSIVSFQRCNNSYDIKKINKIENSVILAVSMFSPHLASFVLFHKVLTVIVTNRPQKLVE